MKILKEKVFVTGGTGFIGQKLIKTLLSDNKEVHALCRKNTKFPLESNSNLKIHYGDILEPDKVQSAIRGCNIAYHLAAYARIWAKNSSTYYNINVMGTKNVLSAAVSNGIKRVVITSTVGTTGPSKDGPVNETSERQFDFFTEYEHSKFVADELAKLYQSDIMDVIFVHPTRVFGPGVGTESNAVTKIIRSFCNDKWRFVLGDGKSIGNYAFVDDVVEGHILAMDKGKGGEKYFLGGDNITYLRFFKLLAELLGKPVRLIKLPRKVVMTFARIERIRAIFSKHYPKITPGWVSKAFLDWPCSCKKAETELGYKITPFKKALARTVEWIDSQDLSA